MRMPRQPQKQRSGRPGHIAQAARDLRVHRSHLWRVINGDGRTSRRLMREYLVWRRDHVGC